MKLENWEFNFFPFRLPTTDGFRSTTMTFATKMTYQQIAIWYLVYILVYKMCTYLTPLCVTLSAWLILSFTGMSIARNALKGLKAGLLCSILWIYTFYTLIAFEFPHLMMMHLINVFKAHTRKKRSYLSYLRIRNWEFNT